MYNYLYKLSEKIFDKMKSKVHNVSSEPINFILI
jgi:hypothetical protein